VMSCDGVEASRGLPILLGVWNVGVIGVVGSWGLGGDGVSTEVGSGTSDDLVSSGASDGLVSSGSMLKMLLLLVTSVALNGCTEIFGLKQLKLGQYHNTSGPSFSNWRKVLLDMPRHSLCIQPLQLSQHSALHSHDTGRSHRGQINMVETLPSLDDMFSLCTRYG